MAILTFTPPSTAALIWKRNPVVVIGVRRRSVGSDNSPIGAPKKSSFVEVRLDRGLSHFALTAF
jgi:hypothetical protein